MKRRDFVERLSLNSLLLAGIGYNNVADAGLPVTTGESPTTSALIDSTLFKQEAPRAVSRTVRDKLGESISVLDFFSPSIEHSDAFEAAFAAGSTSGKTVRIPGGTYRFNKPILHKGDLFIVVDGDITLEWTPSLPANVFFTVDGKLTWTGGRTAINGNQQVYIGINCPKNLPKIENIDFRNILSVAVLAGRSFDATTKSKYKGTNGAGRGYLSNCSSENCGSLAIIAGTGANSLSAFGLIDCVTDDKSGSFTNIFNLASLGYAYVRSGWYRGVPRTSPNMTRTGRCEYIGGLYENMLRGPTVGESVRDITIIGGVSSNMTYSGVSLDARQADRSVPWVNGKIDWTIVGKPSYGVFCQASGVEINALHIGDGSADAKKCTVRLTDAVGVSLGKIFSKNSGSGTLIQLGGGDASPAGSSATKSGDWQTDSKNSNFISISNNSTITYENTRTVTADTTISLSDDILIIDAKSNKIRLVFPEGAADRAIGKSWKFIVTNNDNEISFIRRSGKTLFDSSKANYVLGAGKNGGTQFSIFGIGSGNYVFTQGS